MKRLLFVVIITAVCIAAGAQDVVRKRLPVAENEGLGAPMSSVADT